MRTDLLNLYTCVNWAGHNDTGSPDKQTQFLWALK